MPQDVEEYRGFSIAVVPMKDHEDLWDYEYRLTRLGAAAGEGGPVVRRASAGGHASPEIAVAAAFETARTEVDNLLALEAERP